MARRQTGSDKSAQPNMILLATSADREVHCLPGVGTDIHEQASDHVPGLQVVTLKYEQCPLGILAPAENTS